MSLVMVIMIPIGVSVEILRMFPKYCINSRTFSDKTDLILSSKNAEKVMRLMIREVHKPPTWILT